MDNNYHHQGDLTDIFRASGGGQGSYSTSSKSELAPHDLSSSSSETWHHHHHHHHTNYLSSAMTQQDYSLRSANFFGDPFSNMRDPFLQELDFPLPSSYFSCATNNSLVQDASPAFSATNNSSLVLPHHDNHMRIIRPPPPPPLPLASNNSNTSIFSSNMIQISPNRMKPPSCDSPPVKMVSSSTTSSIEASSSSSSSSLVTVGNMNIAVDNAAVQISSPRNPGLKRRKSQAKKVVCIPAPAAANSRPSSGEVVPSDLWAWRKYGQKPIKGSPYPRGYYRCSSSKGCSARKQVERSRTDPNMLVITYTSEHNHPWPTQRNALAGSTRSQPSSKNNNNNNNASKGNNSDQTLLLPPRGAIKPEDEEEEQDHHHQRGKNSSSSVKEEMEMEDIAEMNQNNDDQELENMMMMDDDDNNNGGTSEGGVLGGVGYKPCMLESHNTNHQPEDFFAELGEIEADPLNLLFTQAGYNEEHHRHQRESKALDPFNLFDWSSSSSASANIHNTTTTTTATTTSLEEPKRGL